MDEIRDYLFSCADEKYAKFMSSLVPTASPEAIIGVRSPVLRAYAKELIKSGKSEGFVLSLPHKYLDENTLHAMIIASEKKDIDKAMREVEAFLPYLDNWASCDIMVPRAFSKYPDKVLERVKIWLESPHTYTKRFALVVLLSNYLDENFTPEILELACGISDGDYYVDMAAAWFYSFALIKRYDEALPLFTERRLPKWVHNKSIQKARESYRISDERKEYLKSMKIY